MLMTFPEYRQAIDQELRARYALSWDDACGDDALLEHEHARGEAPSAFIEWFARKYDLTPLTKARTNVGVARAASGYEQRLKRLGRQG